MIRQRQASAEYYMDWPKDRLVKLDMLGPGDTPETLYHDEEVVRFTTESSAGDLVMFSLPRRDLVQTLLESVTEDADTARWREAVRASDGQSTDGGES